MEEEEEEVGIPIVLLLQPSYLLPPAVRKEKGEAVASGGRQAWDSAHLYLLFFSISFYDPCPCLA